jgi:glucokinase
MKNKEKFSVGIDLGGTNIKIGIVSNSGRIVKKEKVKTYAEEGPDAVVSQIKLAVNNILKKNKNKIEGIGIGSPGIVTLKDGIVEYPPNFPDWGRVCLGKIIGDEFGFNVHVDNDANVAAIGELMFGNGKKLKSFIMVTLGTGMGGGIIFKRKLFRGEYGAAGELGHMTIDYKGTKCNCGSFGCIETFVGNHYMISDTEKQLTENMNSLIWDLIHKDFENLTPIIIQKAAEEGDAFAGRIINEMGFYIGCSLASVTNLLDISTFIIGGGVAGFGKPLFDAIQKTVEVRVLKPLQKRVKILPAKLKNDAGIKGASALVFYKSDDL